MLIRILKHTEFADTYFKIEFKTTHSYSMQNTIIIGGSSRIL